MSGAPRPDRLERLPAQFFTGILADVARARAVPPPAPAVVDLGRGNPDLPPSDATLAAVHAALDETATPAVHGYPPFSGRPALREAIAARYRRDHGVVLDPEREVCVVPGTKTAIVLACLATAQRGGTVVLPDPGYPDYRSGVALAGAREVPLPLDPAGDWQPDWAALSAADRRDMSLLVLNYPSNPCAAAVGEGTFETAVEVARASGATLLHDLAYGFLAFDGARGRSVLEVDGAKDVAVELWSASKVHGMAGWRIGFAVGNAEIVGRLQELVDHTTAGVFSALQRGLEVALADAGDVAARVAVYAARRERLRAASLPGLDVPAGTFYAWWWLPEGLGAATLLREHRVAVAPGEGFGARGAGWARLSLATPDDELDEGLDRLRAACAAVL